MKHGYGRLTYRDSAYFEGFWEEDLMLGKGVFKTMKGQTVFGTWTDLAKERGHKQKYVFVTIDEKIDDVSSSLQSLNKYASGYGYELWNDGEYYRGYFSEGYKNGKGYTYYPDGSFYSGEMQMNYMHGKGEFHWRNKSKYVG